MRGDAALDVARNFIERWNHHRDTLNKTQRYPKLEERTFDDDVVKPSPSSDLTENGESSRWEDSGTCIVQVIRSMDLWSGASRLDRSIYGAYLKAVNSAQHYIYIENQYLSSNIAGGGVENTVMLRILDRLREKMRLKETFRVIIVLPQPEETGDSAMELLRWQYQTINRGGTSVLEQLRYAINTFHHDHH